MLLIADSGSTKTAWCVLQERHPHSYFKSSGINPYMQNQEEIVHSLQVELLPQLPPKSITTIFFYGAGCTPDKAPLLENVFNQLFPQAEVNIHTDLLGAARSLCGCHTGISCILGTGSNSCLYDGNTITHNTPPLGFILGDEGSGAVLGKNLVGELIKGNMPQEIRKAFEEETKLTLPEIIQRVYRSPFPNRFLATLSSFIAAHREHPAIHTFLINNFRLFLVRNVAHYPHAHQLPIHFTGSIAYHFANELEEATHLEKFHIGKIQQNPLEGLVSFHTA